MSFRSLTHYFIHQALGGFDADPDFDPDAPEKTGWEKNMERGSDLNKLHRLAHAITELEPDSIELHSEAGQERLEQIIDLLEQAKRACWQL